MRPRHPAARPGMRLLLLWCAAVVTLMACGGPPLGHAVVVVDDSFTRFSECDPAGSSAVYASDLASLRTAIASFTSGQCIVLTSTVEIDTGGDSDEVHISGGDSSGVVISGNYERRHFTVASGDSLRLTNLTLVYGNATKVSALGDARVGGSIYAGSSTVTLVNTTIQDSVGLDGGGGGFGNGATFNIHGNSAVRFCEADFGAGLAAVSGAVNLWDTASVHDCACIKTGSGGGLYLGNSDASLNDHAAIYGNDAGPGLGGGIASLGSSSSSLNTLTITDHATVRSNTATEERGSGLFLQYVDFSMSGDARVVWNSGLTGAGLYGRGSQLTLSDRAIVANNTASTIGGGITAVSDSTLSVSGSTRVHENLAQSSGGGVFLQESVATFSGDASVDWNSAFDAGGGIRAVESNCSLSGAVLVRGNNASQGGGVSVSDESHITLSGAVRLEQNTAAFAGGGLHLQNNAIAHAWGTVAIALNVLTETVNDNETVRFVAGGGVAALFESRLVLHDSTTVRNNSAFFGGGVAVAAASSFVMHDDSSVQGNTADFRGGGIDAGYFYELEADRAFVRLLDRAGVVDNTCRGGLGGGLAATVADVVLEGSSWVRGNEAIGGAGMVGAISAHINVDGSVVFANNNASDFGGGIMLSGSNTVAELGGGAMFERNVAGVKGGAIFALEATLNVEETTFTRCSSQDHGGAVELEANAVASLTNTTFSECTAQAGGAFSAWTSYTTMQGCLFEHCTATVQGGAIKMSGGTLDVDASEFHNNSVQFADSTCLHVYLYDIDRGWDGAVWYVCQMNDDFGYGDTCDESTPSLMASGTLTGDEFYGDQLLCLPLGFGYTLHVTPSDFENEVTWVLDEGMLNGNDNSTGHFSLTAEFSDTDSGGGAMFLSVHANVTVANTIFNGSDSGSTSGGTIYIRSETVDTSGETQLVMRDSVVIDTAAGLYGSVLFNDLGLVEFHNVNYGDAKFFAMPKVNWDIETGFVFNSGGEVECRSTCTIGWYGNCTETDEGDCASCSSFCVACPAGRYGIADGAFSLESGCELCPEGEATTKEGLVECTECPAGTYAGSNATTEPDGVGVSIGATACHACPVDQITDSAGQTGCTKCNSPFATDVEGETACSCEEDRYFVYKFDGADDESNVYTVPDADSLKCLVCEDGAKCHGFGAIPAPEENYWSDRKNRDHVYSVYPCRRNTCKGADDDSEKHLWLPEALGWVASNDTTGEAVDPDALLCTNGATGVLCGSCKDDYIFSSYDQICVKCTRWGRVLAPALAFGVILFICCGLAAYFLFRYSSNFMYSSETISESDLRNAGLITSGSTNLSFTSIVSRNLRSLRNMDNLPLSVRVLMEIDHGKFKVLWSTLQIITSVSWTLDVAFPEPFATMLRALAFFQLDIFNSLSFACFRPSFSSFLVQVLASSLFPILVVMLSTAFFLWRYHRAATRIFNDEERARTKRNIIDTIFYVYLLVSYIFLPSTARMQFLAFDCIKLDDGTEYLRVDTSVDCKKDYYKNFLVVNICLLALYQCIPISYGFFLFSVREKLVPAQNEDTEEFMRRRDEDGSIMYLKFLFQDYRHEWFWFEVIDMYRRLVFVGFLVLMAEGSRPVAGCGLALLSLVCYREALPFELDTTNLMANVAQYQILITYLGALVIKTEALKLSDFALGSILVAVNFVIILLALYLGMQYYKRESELHHRFNEREFQMIQEQMQTNPADATDEETYFSQKVDQLLAQVKVESADVKRQKKIGGGAFGDVFYGTCMGVPVAIKTVKDVTVENMQAFRAEILLTAALRHPNVVNLVGACWDRVLTAMVLEWVSRGSLQDIIGDPNMSWETPLLRLMTDVARGMSYLHNRKWFDEVTGKVHDCVMHRDLKPENILVTDLFTAKISDFGLSKALRQNDDTAAAMSSVGTPLYAAPEVMRGDKYDESVDVYSYGLMLMDCCMVQPLLDYLKERFKQDFEKKRSPNWMKVVHGMKEKGWEPAVFPTAPEGIKDLVHQCCNLPPGERPTFDDIVHILTGEIAREVASSGSASFPRVPEPVVNRVQQKMKKIDEAAKISGLARKSNRQAGRSTQGAKASRREPNNSKFATPGSILTPGSFTPVASMSITEDDILPATELLAAKPTPITHIEANLPTPSVERGSTERGRPQASHQTWDLVETPRPSVERSNSRTRKSPPRRGSTRRSMTKAGSQTNPPPPLAGAPTTESRRTDSSGSSMHEEGPNANSFMESGVEMRGAGGAAETKDQSSV